MTTTYKRPELTRAVLDWWAGLEVEGVKMWGRAGGDYLTTTYSPFWGFSFQRNSPLGAKHNRTLSECNCCGVDGVMVIGSDDIVEPKLITRSVKAIQKGAMWTQPETLYFYDTATGRCSTPASGRLTGAGRVYSTKLLNLLDWKLFPDDATEKLDGKAEHMIERYMVSQSRVWGDAHKGYVETIGGRVIDGAVLDIKTEVNMWGYDQAVGITAASEVDPEILQKFEWERFTYRPRTAGA
jgi:hypothetical protein